MQSDALSAIALATPLTTTRSAAQDTAISKAMKAQNQRLADMQGAVAKLKSMPSTRVSMKHAAAEQAAMLKRRLDMMKQMLIAASPEVAKGIAAQIRAIAQQLAGLAKVLESGGTASANQSSASNMPEGTAVEEPPTTADSTTAATATTETASSPKTEVEVAEKKSDAIPAGLREGIAAYTAQSTQAAQDKQATNNDDPEKAANKELKKALDEAANALRQLLAMLKHRTGGSKKTAQDIREADAQLREIEKSLAKADNSVGLQTGTNISMLQAEATQGNVEVPVVTTGNAAIGTSSGINIAV